MSTPTPAASSVDDGRLPGDRRAPRVPVLGHRKLATIDVDDLERYIATKSRAKLQPRTINRHLNVLSALSRRRCGGGSS